jgi:hypothetical protein
MYGAVSATLRSDGVRNAPWSSGLCVSASRPGSRRPSSSPAPVLWKSLSVKSVALADRVALRAAGLVDEERVAALRGRVHRLLLARPPLVERRVADDQRPLERRDGACDPLQRDFLVAEH